MRPQLMEAAQIAESLRFYNTRYNDELHWWTAPFEAAEGIPYSALVSAAEGDRVGMERVFPLPHRPERRAEIPEDHAKILLLSTDGDSRADALASGEALSAVLLECTHGWPGHLPGHAPHRNRRHPRTHPVAHGP